MRALITGINGFAGSHLADYLLQSGAYEIWGIAMEPTLHWPHLNGKVQVLAVDLRDARQTSAALAQIRPQQIFHLAGQTFVPASFADPAATLQTNVLGQLHVLLAVLEHAIAARILVVSSYEVYGAITPEDLPIGETTPFRPTNPYGVSKIAQDMLALQYHLSHGLDIVRVRPFNHIGPRQSSRFVAASFAKQIAAIEQGKQPPTILVGNLSAQRDFTDVRDMVRAYVLALHHGESGAVYNIGSGRAVRIQEVLDTLLAASGQPIEVRQDPSRMRPIDVPAVVCDASRFRERTGWQPQRTLAQTLQDILEDWRIRIQQVEE